MFYKQENINLQKKEVISNTPFLLTILAIPLFVMLVMAIVLYEFMLKTGLINLIKTH